MLARRGSSRPARNPAADLRRRGAGLPGRRRLGLGLDGLQQPGGPAPARAAGLVAGGHPAQAPPRPDPEPGRGGARAISDYERQLQTELAALRSELAATPPGVAGPDYGAVAKTVAAVAERYPELKANTTFLALQKNLIDTEQRIALARGYFNDIATHYNTRLEIVPERFVARLAAHAGADADGGERFRACAGARGAGRARGVLRRRRGRFAALGGVARGAAVHSGGQGFPGVNFTTLL